MVASSESAVLAERLIAELVHKRWIDRDQLTSLADRRWYRGGRPPQFDIEAYRGRNVAERSFNALKQWRGLATRYDKLALTYRGGAVLGAIITWLRELGDTR